MSHMTQTTRSEIARALAKAIAVYDCGKPQHASEAWVSELLNQLAEAGVVGADFGTWRGKR